MSIRTPVDFKYGRLHVRSKEGIAADTDLWVEDEDGNRVGLAAMDVVLHCNAKGIWTATVTCALARPDIATSLLRVDDFGPWVQFSAEDSPDSDSSDSVDLEAHLVSSDLLDDATLERGIQAIRRVAHESRTGEGQTLSEGRGN